MFAFGVVHRAGRDGLCVLASLAMMATLAATGPADASACRNPVQVEIRFPTGSYCWLYDGFATHFRGNFRAGQIVRVRMSGDGTVPRMPGVSGPAGYNAAVYDDSGLLEFRTPYSGRYEFNFFPCIAWHQRTRVEICAQ